MKIQHKISTKVQDAVDKKEEHLSAYTRGDSYKVKWNFQGIRWWESSREAIVFGLEWME